MLDSSSKGRKIILDTSKASVLRIRTVILVHLQQMETTPPPNPLNQWFQHIVQ